MNKNSLLIRTIGTLVFFTMTLLFTIYLFQFVFLNYYYENYKIREVKTISKKLEKNLSDIDKYLEDVSINYEVCVERISGNTAAIYNENIKGCILRSPSKNTIYLMENMISSGDFESFYKLENPKYEFKTLLYGVNLSDGSYVFINNKLESMDSATILITGQLRYILFILVVISVFISIFISSLITKPIREITSKAKKMAKGNFDVDFKESSVSEINELSDALNYARNELLKMDDYRRDLMANVGHDLKTPLTLIRSYAEMVKDISYKDDIKRNNHLDVIIRETERLSVLVGDIISLSKLESKLEPLKLERYDIVREIVEVVERFKILEVTENYVFIIDSEDEIYVYADKNKITQVIYNLIGNAINYTGPDMKVYINIKKTKKGAKVEIIDTGKGIKKEELSHIWDRYYKTDKKHKRNVIGTGLGLSIVKNILEEHNFKYGVESSLNEGTKFYFIIKY